MLGEFVEGANRGEKHPDKLLEELEGLEGVSREHKDALKDFLSDDDSAEDEDDGDGDDSDDWSPMHSMHTPDEVQQMRGELESVAPAMKATKNQDARQQYADDLMPAIERVARDGRMLFIQVDT